MENINELKIDARKIGEQGQYAKRLDVIRFYFDEKYSGPQIMKVLKVSKTYVYDTIKLYKKGGLEALKIKKRGRATGTKRSLSTEQEQDIQNTILTKIPEDFDLVETLWTKKNINEMIRKKLNISLPLSTLGDYLFRWNITSQRPIRRAKTQSPEKIDQWMNYDYPEIHKRAMEENAEIFFGDETTIQNTTGYMREYAPTNNPPVVKIDKAKKIKINMISAISRRGKLSFMLFVGNMNSQLFIVFLKRLTVDRITKGGIRKIFLIVDNSRVHHSKIVKTWLEENKDKIEVFFLPSYSPEYNPDELLNSYLKRNMGQVYSRSDIQLKNNAYTCLSALRKRPDITKAFFSSKCTAYAS